MQIEKNLYQMLIDTLQLNISAGGQPWLSGCSLKYCQECQRCGFNKYKIRPLVKEGKVSGLYLDYNGASSEPITIP